MEESILVPKWNRSLSITNELSQEVKSQKSYNEKEKKFAGPEKNSSESETRIQSRGKWQLSPDQLKEADSKLISFWQLIRGESNTAKNFNRELVALEEIVPVPISISPAHPDERKMSDVQVIEVDLRSTEEMEDDQELCAIVKVNRQKKEQKLRRQHRKIH